MIDCAKWTNENTLTFLTILLAIVGGVFAYFKWRESGKLKRSEFINQIIEKLRFDKEMTKTVYFIDYNQDWYNVNFSGSEKEFPIDRLLSYLSYICYLIESGIITKAEVNILDYELRRVCQSHSVQGYLWDLHWWSKSRGSICPFQYLIDYGLSQNIINQDDFKIDSDKYPKYLNS